MFGTQAISREGKPGLTVTGGSKRAGLAGDALAIEDVAGAIDHQDVVGAVAVDVGHQRVGTGGSWWRWPASDRVPSPLPSRTSMLSSSRDERHAEFSATIKVS